MENDVMFICATELGLLGIPILTFKLYSRFKNDKRFILLISFLTGLLAILRYFNFSLRGDLLDLLLPFGIYFNYCFLIFHLLIIKNVFLRVISLIVGFIPIIIGYFVGTIGLLGVMMTSGEEVANKSVQLNKNNYYREYGFGNATSSDGGTKIEIYKSFLLFPLFEKRILSKKLDYSDFDSTDSISVKFEEKNSEYRMKIFSRNKIQFDTIIEK